MPEKLSRKQVSSKRDANKTLNRWWCCFSPNHARSHYPITRRPPPAHELQSPRAVKFEPMFMFCFIRFVFFGVLSGGNSAWLFRRYTERWIHISSVFVFRRESSSCNAPTPTQARSDIPAVAIKSWLCCSTSRLFQCFQVYMHENFIFSVCFFLRSRTKRFRRCFVLLFSISLPSRGIDDDRRVSNNQQTIVKFDYSLTRFCYHPADGLKTLPEPFLSRKVHWWLCSSERGESFCWRFTVARIFSWWCRDTTKWKSPLEFFYRSGRFPSFSRILSKDKLMVFRMKLAYHFEVNEENLMRTSFFVICFTEFLVSLIIVCSLSNNLQVESSIDHALCSIEQPVSNPITTVANQNFFFFP